MQFSAFTRADFSSLKRNLVAVTIGNVVGGAILVAGVYWLLYRRKIPGSS